MVTVRFYGDLKRFGERFELDVRDTAEAVRALLSQINGLRQKIMRGLYKIRIGKQYFSMDTLEKDMFQRLKDGVTVHFTPVLKGAKSGGFQFIVGAVLAVVGYMMSWTGVGAVIGNMGLAMMLGGVAQMLTKTPNMNSGQSDSEKKQSTSFSNLSNMTAQGRPVPLAYGKILTGSLVISQGVETYDVEEEEKQSKKSNKPFGFLKGD